MKRVLLPLILVLATGCPGEDPPENTRVDDVLALTGVSADGDPIYAARCVSCHAADGTGGIGPSLVAEIPGSPEADIVGTVIDGVGTMPGNADLEDQELADLLAYLTGTFG